jgi:tetratricopeptide (TPR) repeat protein
MALQTKLIVIILLFLFTHAVSDTSPSITVGDEDLSGGISLLDEGRISEAREFFEELLKDDPSNPEILFYIGRTYLSENQPGRAVEFFEKATKLDPANSVYHHWLGRTYGRQAMRASVFRAPFIARNSRQSLEKAIELDPENIEARSDLMQYYLFAPGIVGGSKAKAREQAEEIRKRDAMRGHAAFGFIYGREEKYDEAETEFLAAIEVAGDRVEPYYWAGYFYSQREQYDKSFVMFETIIERKPDEIYAYYQIGRVAAESGMNLERGKECLLRYLESTPRWNQSSHARAYVRLGAIYEHEEKPAEARAAYESALKIDPDDRQAKDGLKNLR